VWTGYGVRRPFQHLNAQHLAWHATISRFNGYMHKSENIFRRNVLYLWLEVSKIKK
jgi:hypothetical protein